MNNYSDNFAGINNPNAPASPAVKKQFDTSNLSALFSGVAAFWTSYDAAKNQNGLISPPTAPPDNSGNTWKYVGIGLGVVALLVIIYIAATRK